MSNFKVLGCVKVAPKSYPVGGWVANTYIVMPLRGPTCKIARFQAELEFPSWTECGNITMVGILHTFIGMTYLP